MLCGEPSPNYGAGYTPLVAKRGYNRDTIRGGASDWDVSRPFTSYARLLATLLVHPVRFFEVLPRLPDPRAPGLFLAFSGLPSALLWLVFGGVYPAIAALISPLPLSVALAGLYHLGARGGRYEYTVTWRTVAYPLGFYLPLSAVPVLQWAAGAYAGAALLAVGLSEVQEIPAVQAALVSTTITAFAVAGALYFL